ncbi:hypothetical protein Q4Q39_07000 [Flavivirga amylovorans]|uniref:Gliding motility protein GldL-like N-terminal domain-containing protein n=1 Tax=Flavivirga amylovorans TaxID=870486 RepID=A0ABT8WZN0_9FLAO|nr:hypothetical protein [Flavivirga amylovorans]MDO5987139.1 hypothetical protein [Flavivirga amylovorans]
MKTKNYNYVSIIIIGLVIALIGFLVSKFTYSPDAEFWADIGLIISEFTGFIMLIRNGTFIRTKYFRIFKGVFAIIIIGALSKIMHWQYNNVIMIIGFVLAVLVYFFSFLNKPIKKRLDYLKLIWVIVAYSGAILRFLHVINDEYQIMSSAIMWLAIIDYMKIERGKRRLFE